MATPAERRLPLNPRHHLPDGRWSASVAEKAASVTRAEPDFKRPLIAYSSERREGMRTQIGTANYSYVFIEDALVDLMKREGYRTRYVLQPETFKTERAFEDLLGAAPEQVVHIAFRSTENIRPMRGARNICHFAWEFEVMKDRGLATDSVLANQVQMLGLMDEVWVGCAFTRDVLARYGLTRTHIVPAPIIGADLPRRASFAEAVEPLATFACVPLTYIGGLTREENVAAVAARIMPLADHVLVQRRLRGETGRIFLSVVSPGDRRKNILNMIDGFQLATDRSPEDVLIVKLSVPNKKDFLYGGLYDSFSPLCLSQMSKSDPNVIFLMDYFTAGEMDALFNMADFYVSASHCEGYNLPLLQAMAYGAIPVSTLNTAMLDYLDGDNAIVIKEKTTLSPVERMAGDVANMPYALGFASRFDIGRAIAAARTTSPDAIDRLSAAARRTVRTRYGAKQVADLIAGRLASLAPAAAA